MEGPNWREAAALANPAGVHILARDPERLTSRYSRVDTSQEVGCLNLVEPLVPLMVGVLY
jgi:hypothetical protein